MSWFGFGGSSEKEDKERPMKIDEFDSHSASQFDNSHSSTNFAPSAGSGGSFEQELAMEQQKAIIQAVMFKLTEASFDACVTKPSSSLSRSEQSCISAVVGKYLDTSELVASRLQGGGGQH